MILTDLSVKRPVFASVISILLIAFGLVAFEKLPLREYPNIDPPWYRFKPIIAAPALQ